MNVVRENWMPATLPAPLAMPIQDLMSRMLGVARERPLKQVMMIGAASGVGTSFIALRWSAQMAPAFGRVLLIEVKPGTSGTITAEEVDTAFAVGGAVVTITMPELTLLGLVGRGAGVLPADWLENFGLILWDVPPLTLSPVAAALAHDVDAVVLVAQAHRTRRHVAMHAAERLQQSGGKLVGVVLNRTLDFIPRWIYRRL